MIWKLFVAVFAAVLAIGAGRLAGGWWEADVHYPGVQEALEFAVDEHHNIGINNEVIIVKIQVVAGLNYNITVKTQEGLCYFVVFSQTWTNTMMLTDSSCT